VDQLVSGLAAGSLQYALLCVKAYADASVHCGSIKRSSTGTGVLQIVLLVS
jgi:hypothetical protein